MQPSYYRLNSETFGIASWRGQETIVTLPEGTMVTVADAIANSRMIDVFWDGIIVTMFTQDLDERGVLEDPEP